MIAAANPHPCVHCPWRTANHGKRHPDGWYTAANRRRLWTKLRTGESMSCHPTDPGNPVPEGCRAVPEGTVTHECTGALILQQREVMRLQSITDTGGSIRDYRRRWPLGMTVAGLAVIVSRHMFRGTPMAGIPMASPDLNEPVSHLPLGEWRP